MRSQQACRNLVNKLQQVNVVICQAAVRLSLTPCIDVSQQPFRKLANKLRRRMSLKRAYKTEERVNAVVLC